VLVLEMKFFSIGLRVGERLCAVIQGVCVYCDGTTSGGGSLGAPAMEHTRHGADTPSR
jgi:hypothetical protein